MSLGKLQQQPGSNANEAPLKISWLRLGGKLENNLATTLVSHRLSNSLFGLIDRIGSLDFGFQNPAFRNFKQGIKCRHSFGRRRFVIPMVDPDSAKPQIFENEQPGWNLQRLQTHRAEADQCSAKCQAVSDP